MSADRTAAERQKRYAENNVKVVITKETKELLDHLRTRQGLTIPALIDNLVRDALDQLDKPVPPVTILQRRTEEIGAALLLLTGDSEESKRLADAMEILREMIREDFPDWVLHGKGKVKDRPLPEVETFYKAVSDHLRRKLKIHAVK